MVSWACAGRARSGSIGEARRSRHRRDRQRHRRPGDVAGSAGASGQGEVLRLRWRRGCMPPPQQVGQGARPAGLSGPRSDGVVIGATQYEHGRDTAPSVSGVRELLDACAVMPALGEYELAESAAGLRPMTGQHAHRRPPRRQHPGGDRPRTVRFPAGAVDGQADRRRTPGGSNPMNVLVNDKEVGSRRAPRWPPC